MNSELKSAFKAHLSEADALFDEGDFGAAFARLETAHILGQQFFLPHVAVHLRMLRIGKARRDDREVRGQAVRLLATVPGFLFGWVPVGNTGGANVPATRPMPVPPEIAGLVPAKHYLRGLALRLVFLALLILIWRSL